MTCRRPARLVRGGRRNSFDVGESKAFYKRRKNNNSNDEFGGKMRGIMKDTFAGGHGFSRSISHRVTGWEAAQELTDRLTVVAAQEKFTAGWISVGTPSTLSLLISKSNWRRGPQANRAGVSSVPLHTTPEVSSDRSIFGGDLHFSCAKLSW